MTGPGFTLNGDIKIEKDGRANLMHIFFYRLDENINSSDLVSFEGELLIAKSSVIHELNLTPTCRLFFENFDAALMCRRLDLI